MRKHLLTFLALTLFGVAGAQTTHFGQSIGTAYSTNGMGSIRLATGSFITVSSNASSELELTRYNSNGVVQSTHKLTSAQYSFTSVASVVPAGSNAILVTGEAYSNTAFMNMFYVARVELSTNTMTLAVKTIDAFSYTKGPKAFYSPEGSIYALFPQYGYFDIHKMDGDLTPLWSRTIECDTVTGKNPGMDCEVVDSSIIIVGKCDSLLGCGDVDTSGSLDSFKLYMINGYTRIYNITKTPDGALLLAGLHSPVYASGPDSRPLLAKVNRDGSPVWARVLDQGIANTFARFVDVQVLPNGNIIGFTTMNEAYSDTYFDGACVFDASGNLLASYKFSSYNGTTGEGNAYQLYDAKIYASGILLSGNIVEYPTGTVKRVMIFTDENFTQVCDKVTVTVVSSTMSMGSVNSFGPEAVREGTGVAPAILSAGTFSPVGSFPADVCAITTGVEEEQEVGSSVYPNPVSAGGNIFVEMEESAMYELVITDLSGKVVNRQSTVGNRATISTQGLATGAYILNVVRDQHTVAIDKLLVK